MIRITDEKAQRLSQQVEHLVWPDLNSGPSRRRAFRTLTVEPIVFHPGLGAIVLEGPFQLLLDQLDGGFNVARSRIDDQRFSFPDVVLAGDDFVPGGKAQARDV